MSVSNSSVNITQPTTINSSLKANQFYCTTSTVNYTSIVSGGTTYYGFFVPMNGWWSLGYSYLTISASITMGGINKYCWNGRVFLSPSNGVLTTAGVMSIIVDYQYPATTGPYYITVEERWDGNGTNYLRFYGSLFTAGILQYKIYG